MTKAGRTVPMTESVKKHEGLSYVLQKGDSEQGSAKTNLKPQFVKVSKSGMVTAAHAHLCPLSVTERKIMRLLSRRK